MSGKGSGKSRWMPPSQKEVTSTVIQQYGNQS